MKSKKTNAKAAETEEKNRYQRFLEDSMRIARNAGEPTYRFEVGEKVLYGAWQECTITEVLFDGMVYTLDCSSVKKVYGVDTVVTDQQIQPWIRLRPAIPSEQRTSRFSTNEDIRLSYTNVTVESLMSRHYHFGVNFEPPYQRGYVWTQKDRDLLLESIFMGADIGKFVFKKISEDEWLKNKAFSYEIIDGKQRLLTILSFYENRWAYKGVFFNELSNGDRRRFLDAMTALAEVRNATPSDTLRLFLRLNRGGRPVSNDVIEQARTLLESYEHNPG